MSPHRPYRNKPRHLRLVETEPQPNEELAKQVGKKALENNVFPLGLRLKDPPEMGWERPDGAA